jgi:hypothetical protein
MREWIRHRMGSFNELSGRYAKIDDSFYVPALEDVRTQVGKPGAYTFEAVPMELAEATRLHVERGELRDPEPAADPVRLYGPGGVFLGLGRSDQQAQLHARRLFVPEPAATPAPGWIATTC